MPAYVLFHQGWTDIFNCLALITYYSKQYRNLTVIVREDALPIVKFYLGTNSVKILAIKKESLDKNPEQVLFGDTKIVKLYHGEWDIYRDDEYRHAFHKSTSFFVERFYVCYGMPYQNRINYFQFQRNFEAEDITFKKFISEVGNNYILTHADPERGLNVFPPNGKNTVFNLNGVSSSFFEWIKVLEGAQEIHLIDSVWSAFIYQIDAKYRLFKKIPIYMYCLRGYQEMYQKPIHLENWSFR